MPAEPTLPDGAETLSEGLFRAGDDLYITGTVALNLGYLTLPDAGMNLYVLHTGALTLLCDLPARVSLYNYGTLRHYTASATFTVNADAALYSLTDLNLTGTALQVDGGLCYVDGALTARVTNVVDGGTLCVGCNSSLLSLTLRGEATRGYVRGTLACSKFLSLEDGGSMVIASGSTLTVGTNLEFWDTTSRIEVDGTGYAFVRTGTVSHINTDLTGRMPGHIALKSDYWRTASREGNTVNFSYVTSASFSFYSSVLIGDQITEAGLTWPDGCGAPAAAKTIYRLEQLAGVAADTTLANRLSAASITADDNGHVYVSWHLTGGAFQGRVEVAQVTASGCTLLQALTTEASAAKTNGGRDYNHIMVDAASRRLYAVGSENKGGFIAYNDLTTEGLIANNELHYRRLQGGDGNCILRNGDYLQLATTYGLEVYEARNLRRVTGVELPGKGKYIATDGSRVVTLSFASRETTASRYYDRTLVSIQQATGLLHSYAASDLLLSDPTTLASDLEIAPADGKNVVALDGDDVYVACGAAGVVRYSAAAGAATGSFAIAPASDGYIKGYANGVAVDARYVYVAYGSAGVYVLDKSTLSVVARYTNVGGKSANFVYVHDGLIYVAYGKSGWEVLELVAIG
jgi:hypothetical protein